MPEKEEKRRINKQTTTISIALKKNQSNKRVSQNASETFKTGLHFYGFYIDFLFPSEVERRRHWQRSQTVDETSHFSRRGRPRQRGFCELNCRKRADTRTWWKHHE